jgi:hypothetical protein
MTSDGRVLVQLSTSRPGPVKPLHPRHGTHAPTTSTPARLPSSVRRTTSHDMRRRAGLQGDLVITGLARDLVTGPDRDGVEVDRARIDITIDFTGRRDVTAITCEPPLEGANAFNGVRAFSGFRRVLRETFPAEVERSSLTHRLLDDIPVATLISGYTIMHDAPETLQMPPGGSAMGICAGWAEGATIAQDLEAQGMPPLTTGPEAPVLTDPSDPVSWHRMPALAPTDMRRQRRVDLTRDDAGDLVVDAMFRDTHMAENGFVSVIHEYTIDATVDAATMLITSIDATPRALPFVECPAAALSATRLVGRRIGDLGTDVRDQFTGISTCTHLNDALRAFDDVAALVHLLG